MAKKRTVRKRIDGRDAYTATQLCAIRERLDKAHNSTRKGAVVRATSSLANRFNRSEHAITQKYGRIALGWNSR